MGRAAINFHKSYQTLAVFTVSAFDAEFLKSEHRHAHADEIARAEVAVRLFGIGGDIRREISSVVVVCR